MNSFSKNQDYKTSIGLLLLRLFIGLRLIYGVLDNVFSMQHMHEFEAFLQQFGFPFPLILAFISVYVQLLGGICLLIGFKTKWAGLLIAFNFLVAILAVHLPSADSIEVMTPAVAMFVVAVALFFTGAGKFAIDKN